MWTWLRRLMGLPSGPSPRLVTALNRIDELDERIEYLGAELKRLRGRVTGGERKETPQEAAERENDEAVEHNRPAGFPARRRALRGF